MNRNRSFLVLVLLLVVAVSYGIDPQTNPHRDAGAVRRANNLSDVLDASTARANLDVPSNASSVASLSAHNVAVAVHGSTSVASEARVADHELDQSTHGATEIASAAALSAHTDDSSDPHGTSLTQTNASMTRLDVSGDVGVGSAPKRTADGIVIHVHEMSGTTPEIRLTNSHSGQETTDGLSILNTGTDTYIYNRELGAQIFGTNNAERLRIDSSGNVGIGTSTPKVSLHLSGAMSLIPQENPPSYAAEGTIYMDTDHHLYVHNGTTWVQLDN